jgi:hypothetical protein
MIKSREDMSVYTKNTIVFKGPANSYWRPHIIGSIRVLSARHIQPNCCHQDRTRLSFSWSVFVAEQEARLALLWVSSNLLYGTTIACSSVIIRVTACVIREASLFEPVCSLFNELTRHQQGSYWGAHHDSPLPALALTVLYLSSL